MIFLVIFIALFLMIIFRKNTKKVIGILVLIIGIIGGTCYFSGNGVKSYYCLPQNNCITVWKRSNGDIYIIYGKYKSKEILKNNYIAARNIDFVDVIFIDQNKIIVSIEEKNIIKKSSDNLLEVYDEKKNDSLTYFDEHYTQYKKGVNYISLYIKENYATDKNGKKIE